MSFRALTEGRGIKLGTMVGEFATPGIGHILKAAGFDYAFLDMEHSGFGIDILKAALRYFEAAGLPVLLRPPSKAAHHISRALDAGADALLLPMVATAAEAKALSRAMHYAPKGHRGVALGMAHDRYTVGPAKSKLAALNRRNMFIALIETVEGLANVEAIAKVAGVDGLWVGHFDLSTSMGIPGQFTDRRFTAALRRIAKAAAMAGKPLGKLVDSPREGIQRYRQGFGLICYKSDVGLLQGAAADGLKAIRASLKRKAVR